MTLLAGFVEVSGKVAATRAHTKKFELLGDFPRRLDASEVPLAVGFLVGIPRQGRVGVGWAKLASVDAGAAPAPSLSIADLDGLLDEIGAAKGAGSSTRRSEILRAFLGRATAEQAGFVRRLLIGDLRQGALEGVIAEAVARTAGIDAELVRRGWMLSGDLCKTAAVAMSADGLRAIGLEVLRPVEPMLASTAESIEAALAGMAPARWSGRSTGFASRFTGVPTTSAYSRGTSTTSPTGCRRSSPSPAPSRRARSCWTAKPSHWVPTSVR